MSSNKRPKGISDLAKKFLSVAAVESDEEEKDTEHEDEFSEEEANHDSALEDFLVREEDDAQQQDSSARSTRPLPVRQPEDTPEDLEELAKSFVMRDTMQRRHDRSSAISMKCTPDGLQAATEALSKGQAPKKDSHTMWMLRTRSGVEQSVAKTFREYFKQQAFDANQQAKQTPQGSSTQAALLALAHACNTTSVHVSDYLPRRVYIYTSYTEFIHSVRRRYNLPSLPVPIDYGDTQAILWPKRNEIQEGDCVRILKGTYKGDLGYALKQLGQDAIRITLVPRLSLAPPAPFSVPNDAQQPDDGMQQQEKCKKRKKAAPRISRPPAIPFDVDRARAIFGYNCVTQGDTESRYTFRPRRVRHDQTFERGLLILDLYASGSLKRELHPSSEELIPLAESGIDGDRLNRRLAAYFLRAGDRIMITEGNYQGLFGKILDTGLDNDSLLVEIFNENSPNWTVTVRAAEICQDLRVGDCVRAIAGGDKGAHGVITMVHPHESFDVQGIINPCRVTFCDDKLHMITTYRDWVETYNRPLLYSLNDVAKFSASIDRPNAFTTHFQRNPLIGQAVVILHGPDKGLHGEIRDDYGTTQTYGVLAAGRFARYKPEHLALLEDGRSVGQRLDGSQMTRTESESHAPSRSLTPCPEHVDGSLSPAWDPSSHLPGENSENSNAVPPPPPSFLLDDTIWKDLGTRHIRVKFALSFRNGSYANRVGKTESPSRFAGPYGIVKAGEVVVSWTDNHSKLVGENVEVKHLQPAMPQAKGQECVVLNGLRCGKILEAKKVRKQDKIVTLTDGIGTWDEPFENVCVVEMSK